MSGTVQSAIVNPDCENGSNEALGQGQPARSVQHKNYKGFVAGIFSGVSKLSGRVPCLYSTGGNLLIASDSWSSFRYDQSSIANQ